MKLEFNDSFISGIEEIDSQHKDLFDAINQMKDWKGDFGKIWRIFNAIEKYAETHFETEEEYMKKLQYPDIEEHTSEHKKFTEKYEKMKARFRSGGFLFKFIDELYEFLAEWLTDHYNNTDIKLIEFIKANNKAEIKQ